MTNIALSISIILGTGFLAHGYSLAGIDIFTRWFIALGVIWLIAQYSRLDWFSAVALILVILTASLGLWMDFHAGWLIAGSIFSLVAWDLTEFRRQLRTMAKDGLRGVERRHITRLGFLALAGLIFATLLLLVREQFTLDWGILLLVMSIVSLIQFIVGARVK
ncbi:MAG: hypothetical protein HY863_16845 [Chloroflexi bacterium]|nr:hypothetical protein [Chloroflexota bacterium]